MEPTLSPTVPAMLYPPSEATVQRARISGRAAYDRLVAEAEADPEAYWGRLARELIGWKRPFTQVLDQRRAPFFEWFADGTLNAA